MSERTTLYLRGVPRGLVREAKVAAARRGSTLAALVCETLEQGLHAGPAPAAGPEVLAAERRWYEENRAALLRRYPGEYLAVVGGQVLDHDRDFEPLAERVFALLGPRAVFMPRLEVEAKRPRLRSPRRRRT